jgi:outer membrane protein assembly factor BamB
MPLRSLLASSFVLCCLLSPAVAEDWSQFRGPGGRGRSAATGLPTTWSAAANIVWKKELPGHGASSPITYGDRIYVTCYSGYGLNADKPGDPKELERHLVCLNRKDGSLVWDQVQPATTKQEPYQGFAALHGYASSTPAADTTGIYVYYGATGAAAYSHQGEQRWLTSCGSQTHDWGSATSPVLFDNLVILNACVESGALVALEKATGKEAWRRAGMRMSWNTPALVKTARGTTELVVQIQGRVLAFDPATGEPLWDCKGIDDYVCPSILAQDDVVYVIAARSSKGLAIRAGGKGDVTDTHKLWDLDKGSNVSSPVYHEGHLYWAHESRGVVYCADAKTGKLVYEERLKPSPGRIYASPLLADGKLYYTSRDKGTFVVAAKPEFELLAHNRIETDDSIFNGSPIVSDGQLLLRSNKFLYCIR